MYTGYYAKLNRYIDAGLFPISVSNTIPYKLGAMTSYIPFIPNRYVVGYYKAGKIDEKEYYNIYITQLDMLDRDTCIREVLKLTNGMPPIFVCYECFGSFCHRHILADWIGWTGKYSIMEYMPK